MKFRIVIPMAGRGSRYAQHGWDIPKPLIQVAGRPMIFWALESLQGLQPVEIIFVVLKEHEEQFDLTTSFKAVLNVPFRMVVIPDVTEGQLCTVMAAKEFINDDCGVLVASSDTLVIGNLLPEIELINKNPGGVISVMDLPGDQWSFAKADAQGNVLTVAEKVRISDNASTGLYYFSSGAGLVRHATQMIQNNERTRGEFYVIPVYTKMIESAERVVISTATAMWDMGTPAAKTIFENNIDRIKNQLSQMGEKGKLLKNAF